MSKNAINGRIYLQLSGVCVFVWTGGRFMLFINGIF